MNTIATHSTAWAVKKIRFFYSGTFNAPADCYVCQGYDQGSNEGRIVLVANKAAADRIAKALDPAGTYYLSHGEYSRPEFVSRRLKVDPSCTILVSEETACRLLGLDCDLEVGE